MLRVRFRVRVRVSGLGVKCNYINRGLRRVRRILGLGMVCHYIKGDVHRVRAMATVLGLGF